MSSISVQFFVNTSITLRYFPTKVYVFWISIEFFLCFQWNWNKQGDRFKNDADFRISNSKSPQFYFFRIRVTLPYSSCFCLKNVTKIFLESFGWQYFAIFVIKPQIYVKLWLKTEFAPFLWKMWKIDSNILETWPLGTDRAYNC